MVPEVVGSRPIFHPKFKPWYTLRLFYLILDKAFKGSFVKVLVGQKKYVS